MNQIVLVALIAALQKEVVLLESELNNQMATIATYVPPQNIGYSNPVYIPPATPSSEPILGSASIPSTILPTLYSDPACASIEANPHINIDSPIYGFCTSTSTAMCPFYFEGTADGPYKMLSCVQVALCGYQDGGSGNHNCPNP